MQEAALARMYGRNISTGSVDIQAFPSVTARLRSPRTTYMPVNNGIASHTTPGYTTAPDAFYHPQHPVIDSVRPPARRISASAELQAILPPTQPSVEVMGLAHSPATPNSSFNRAQSYTPSNSAFSGSNGFGPFPSNTKSQLQQSSKLYSLLLSLPSVPQQLTVGYGFRQLTQYAPCPASTADILKDLKTRNPSSTANEQRLHKPPSKPASIVLTPTNWSTYSMPLFIPTIDSLTLYLDQWTAAYATRQKQAGDARNYNDIERYLTVPAFAASAANISKDLKTASGSNRESLGGRSLTLLDNRPSAPLPDKGGHGLLHLYPKPHRAKYESPPYQPPRLAPTQRCFPANEPYPPKFHHPVSPQQSLQNTGRDHVQVRVDELTVEIRSAEERIQLLQPATSHRSTNFRRRDSAEERIQLLQPAASHRLTNHSDAETAQPNSGV
ncbi:MAG: hypothetical protein Q9169_006572 [Polycauliona sp. 2 TL-2023]